MVTSPSVRNHLATKMQQGNQAQQSSRKKQQPNPSASPNSNKKVTSTPGGAGNKSGRNSNPSSTNKNNHRKPSTNNANKNSNQVQKQARAVSTPPRQTPQKYSNLNGNRYQDFLIFLYFQCESRSLEYRMFTLAKDSV